MKRQILTALAVLGLGGCASVQPPLQKVKQSQAVIRAAEAAGANEVPSAKVHLEQAKKENRRAQGLIDRGSERAEIVLDNAILDAELAEAIAKNRASEALLRSAAVRQVQP